MNTRKAYTLVELCVVLAIVVVLSLMLFGVFSRVREKSRQATCQSNLHQIYLALSQYVADNDNHFPNDLGWSDSLSVYIKTQDVFVCPSIPRPFPPELTAAAADRRVDYTYARGWVNGLTFLPSSSGLPTPVLSGLNEATTLQMSRLPIISEILIPGYFEDVPLPRGAACGLTDATGTPQLISQRATHHNGGFNQLFYDGQVIWTSPQRAAQIECDLGRFAQPPFRAGGPHIPASNN